MASKGRNGDSMLVHMTPGEVAGLHALAMKHGGSLTINPETGLPEANFLKSLLPMLAGAALNFFAPGVGTAISGALGIGGAAAGAIGTGIAVGGLTTLATGSLSRGLMAGLGAYGGAGLEGSLMGAGEKAVGSAAEGIQGPIGSPESGFGATQAIANAPKADLLSTGFDAAKADPMAFAKQNLGNIAYAATPILADQMVPTTTKAATPTDTGNIRKFSFDPYSQRYTPQGVFPAKGYTGGMADGGIVALADGGSLTPEQIKALATPTTTAADFATATAGYNPQDVNKALQSSGLSGAAQYALTHQDIGDKANTAENYGGISGLSNNINYWLGQNKGATANDINAEMAKWSLSDEDFKRATGKSVADYTTGDITKVNNLPGGVGGNTSAVVNPNGTITQVALPTNVTGGQPTGTVNDIKKIYTEGGGSLGYTPVAPKTMEEFNQRFNTLTPDSDSQAAYNYLIGKGAYPTKSNVGEIMKPYSEAVLGVPQDLSTKKYIWNPTTRKMVLNPDYVPMAFDTKGVQSFGQSTNDISKYLKANSTATDAQIYAWALANNVTPEQIAAALGADVETIRAKWNAAKSTAAATAARTAADSAGDPTIYGMADGGATGYAVGGGLGSLGSYSDGGRLLKGPGDGVSDSIPATIGAKGQPARLADGEFVVPARIVSELGNGSTDAGAKKLYAMMDRVQKARGKTTGKNKIAANSRADKYLPA
jgi:hypothetical protein